MRPDEARNRAAIGAIGSLASGGLVMLFGFMLTPYLENRAGIQRILVVGNVMFSLGLGLAAASTRYWQVVLTQGLMGGIGSGLVQIPLIMLVPEYFSNRSGKAMGAVTCAAGLGGLTYTPLIHQMLDNIGTRKTLGVLSAINAVILVIATIFAQGPRKFAKRSTCRVPLPIFEEPIFLLVILMTLFNTLSISVPFQYGPEFSQSLGFSATKAATLLAIHNGTGSCFGMLIGHFGDKIGHLNTLILGMAVTSLATWIFWLDAAVNQVAWPWYVFIACHGLAGSVYTTLIASLSVQLFGNENYIAVSGILGCARGVGYVAGSPLAGLVLGEAKGYEKSSKDFKAMIVWIAGLLSACTFCFFIIRSIEARKRCWKWKI
ncbi:MFS general substrate transporter [Mytilinidion resinicola]|uniref:MFS general substrate transporter n=1 Tax=Mytilinidion resinicola TaxID=574789 RepID=A0A6A6Y6P5_9PEZI|nr:MFS general substrate transporter [Mytilinidion resinicola]KAF2803477.1 MFS general substrate transporter [Mytilinidion resinicola]